MKILLIDDHPLFRAGICGILNQLNDSVELTEANSCEEALERVADSCELDLVLLDLNLPGIDGLQGLKKLRDATPATPIVVLSASEERDKIKQAIAQGAKGYIPKSSDSDVILSALRLVLSGGIYLPMAIFEESSISADSGKITNGHGQKLTNRQHEVLLQLVQGKSNKHIANSLDMAENTVRVHVAAILKFLSVNNRTEAAYAAKQQGLI